MPEDYGTATWRYWQWFENDSGARGSLEARPPVPVRARLVFEHNGAVSVNGSATRLGFDRSIFVENADRRCRTTGVVISIHR